MYAHNNTEIDYFKIACANALMVQRNLGVPVTLVTDEGTVDWGRKALGEELVHQCFERVITVDRNYKFNNPRNFSDTVYSTKNLQFYNCNHWAAYDLSPYNETLFIDADYLIMSDALNNCWGSDNDVMINHTVQSPYGDLPHTKYIDDFGIRLYWATVIYFKKSELAQHLFSIVQHVQDNYRYYKDLYYFSNGMFRNDNAFSIAVHTMNGFVGTDSLSISQLPITRLLMAWDSGDIHSIPSINDIVLYTEKSESKGTYLLTRLKNTDVHIMNKWAINRFSDRLIELYQGNRSE